MDESLILSTEIIKHRQIFVIEFNSYLKDSYNQIIEEAKNRK